MPFEIECSPPLAVKQHLLTLREGITIEVYDSHGHMGSSEVSPLPYLSQETIPQVIGQLSELAEHIPLLPIVPTQDILNTGLEKHWHLNKMHKSVAFGIETAYLSCLAAKNNLSLAQTINPKASQNIKKNALITPHLTDPFKQIENARKKGITCFKIKIGHQKKHYDVEIVSEIAAELEDYETIRLDSNGLWDLETWVSASITWEGIPIEYVEDPVATFEQLIQFYDLTQLHPAADEYLNHVSIDDLIAVPGLAAIVIKPTLLGSISKLHAIYNRLKSTHIKLIISSAYESPTGHAVLIELAKAYSGGSAVGLNTQHFLSSV